jgi:hypothetical protein
MELHITLFFWMCYPTQSKKVMEESDKVTGLTVNFQKQKCDLPNFPHTSANFSHV